MFFLCVSCVSESEFWLYLMLHLLVVYYLLL